MLKFPDLEKYRFSKIVFFKRFLILVTIGFCASLSHALEPLVNDYVLRFNVDRYALAPDDEQLKLGDSFTMMGWFFWDEEVKDATLMGQLSANWPEWPDFAQILQTRYGDGVIEFGVSDGTEVLIISATEPTPVGEWVHLAAVLDGGWMRLFINGAEVSNGPFSGSPVSDVARFSIGSGVNSGPYTAGSRFNGFISEVSVWTKGLSLGEIQNAATVGLTGNEDGLVAYWKLDDQPESFVVQDYSGNGLDMRLDQSVEGPYWARWRPLQYPMEAVENPYFEVIEFDWPGATSIIEHSLSDMYIIDLNNDGLDDIVISQSVWPDFPELSLIALRNQGDLTFTEFTDSKLGSVNTITARQGRVSDYDGDGLDDLFLIDTGSDVPPFPGWQNTLLLGNADGLIRDVSSTHLPLLNDLNHGLDIGDIDGDGDIDIFTGQQPAYWIAPWFSFEGSKPEIFINDGTGQFTLERERLPESEQLHAAPAVGLLDADRDGFPDVFFSHQAMYDTVGDGRNPIVRLKNDGTGSFEFPNSGDIIDNEFFHLPDWMGVEMASVDVNNDGYLDLLIAYQGVPDDGGGIWLFLNNQDDTFTKIENAFPSEYFDVIHSGWWIIYLRTADFNGDGWIDVHGEGVAIGDYLFLNNGDNTFTNASSILSPKVNTSNSISNVLDIDNDGRLDILSVADGKIQVLRNVRVFSTGAPYTPVPTAPMLGAVESIQVGEKLSWQDTGTAYAFDLEIASDPEFEDIVYQRSEYTGLSIEPANLQEGATYYWRVRGINTQGTGLWSEGSDFEVSLPPIIQPPVNDYVLRFSENRYALAPDDERLKLGDSFTMMGWFFWDEEPKEATLMGQLSADWPDWPGVAHVLQIRAGDGLPEFVMYNGTDIQWATASEPLPVGEWVHLACVFDEGRMRLYVSGIEVSNVELSGAPIPDVARFAIGSAVNIAPETAGSLFSGYISQISVWSRGLDGSQIRDSATKILEGDEDGLISYWKLDDLPESFVVQDYSGNGLDMRLDQNANATYWANWRPLQYPMEAVENPYFEVIEYEWLGSPWLRMGATEDLYILDLDGDGMDDAILSETDFENFNPLPLLALRNEGDLTFSDVTDSKLGVIDVILARDGAVGDFNSDGLDDLILAETGPDFEPIVGDQNTLLLGNADGPIIDVSYSHLPLINNGNHGVDVGDIDGDGDLDIFAGQQPRLYFDLGISPEEIREEVFINDGSGGFSLERNRLPELDTLFASPSVGLLDANRDGTPDIFLAAHYTGETTEFGRTPIIRYVNNGFGQFQFPGMGGPVENEFYFEENVTAIDFESVDVNNDGYLDLLVSYQGIPDDGGGIWLFLNNRDNTFTKIDNAFPSEYFDIQHIGWWIVHMRTGDFNEDGWTDVLGEGGAFGDFLFLNNGDNTFTNAGGILTPQMNAWGSVSNVIDIDNDGRLDILSVAEGKIQVLHNVRDLPTGAPYTPVPEPPVLNAVRSLTSGERLSWQDSATAYAFDIEVATEPEFENLVYQRDGYTGMSIPPANLQDGITYHWRVRAINAQGPSEWSEVSSFAATSSMWSDFEDYSGWLFGWLGWIQETSSDHIFHLNLGSIYYTGVTQDSLWFYVYAQNLGWLWAGKGLYPFMYSPERGYLMHLEGTDWFLDWDTEEWFQVTP